MYDALKETTEKLEKLFPDYIIWNEFHFKDIKKEECIQINDILNQMFLKFFCEITLLPLSAFHASEAGEQYDDLIKAMEEQIDYSLDILYRFDISNNLKLRTEFEPFIFDLQSLKM